MIMFTRFPLCCQCCTRIFIVLLLHMSASKILTEGSTPCLTKLDVAFAIDSSYSVGSHNFREILKMVSGFSKQMPVSWDGVRVALVTFSDVANTSFLLNQGVSYDAIQDLLDDTTYLAGSTQTGLALRTLRRSVFTVGKGDRPGVPNLVIVVTDGTASNPEMLAEESRLLSGFDTQVFAVGLGFLADPTELEMLAGKFVFSTDFLDQPQNVTGSLVQAACQRFGSRQLDRITTPLTPADGRTSYEISTKSTLRTSSSNDVISNDTTDVTQATVPSSTDLYSLLINTTHHPDSTSSSGTVMPSLQIECDCIPSGPSDIVLVVDSSDTVGPDHFRSVQLFMLALLGHLNVTSKSDVRLGVIQYSDDAREAVRLRHFNSSQSLSDTIMGLNFTGGGINTAAALNVLASQVLTTPRPHVAQLGLLITSGASRQPELSRLHARILHHHRGVHLFTMGVGSMISGQELENIASVPTDKHVFVADDFTQLQSLEIRIVTALCKDLGSPCSNDSTEQFGLRVPTKTESTSHEQIECQNLHANCSDITEAQCSDDLDWSRRNCALSCRLCADTKNATGTCVDEISNCHSYGTYVCADETYRQWATDNCAGYCNFCNQTDFHKGLTPLYSRNNSVVADNTTSGEGERSGENSGEQCVDLIADCANYGGPEVCRAFKAWASVRCRAYCGFCQQYIVTSPVAVNGTKCPQWRLPVECSMTSVEWSWCPMPSCPDGYFLTATRQQ